jgi:hypothetical protein
MMMKYIALTFLITLNFVKLCSQIDSGFLAHVHRVIAAHKQKEVLQSAEIAKLKNQISQMAANKRSSPVKLTNAIQEWELSNFRLKQSQGEVADLRNQLKSARTQTRETESLLSELTKINDEMMLKLRQAEAYNEALFSTLQRQGRQNLYSPVDEKELPQGLATYKNKKKHSQRKSLLFTSAGYKFFTLGEFCDFTYGYIINQNDKNIFIGIGAGYDYFRSVGYQSKDSFATSFSSIPIHFSSRISIVSGFITEDDADGKITEDGVVYLLADLGFSKIISNQKKTPRSTDIFSNLGLGVAGAVAKNISLNAELTWRRQSVQARLLNNAIERQFINTMDLRIGLCFYLNR